MARSQLETTNFDHEEIKASLIDFLKSTNEFDDFDYEGSAINTIVDLLTRNTTYAAYMANMLANESFIDSAQLRGNVVSHAQKLSYTPRSYVASRVDGKVTVIPSSTVDIPETLTMNPGTVFLSNSNNTTFSFVNIDTYQLNLDPYQKKYISNGVQLYQGQYIVSEYVYDGNVFEIPNEGIDISTLTTVVSENGGKSTVYKEAKSIVELSSDVNVYFISENHKGKYQIEFGKNILGAEPQVGSIVRLSYINTENEHANGATEFVSATPVSGYSNLSFDPVSSAWGGGDRETLEDIRFIAPKIYQAQDRALTSYDYAPLIKSKYPFIKSIVTWGGEDNDPPIYGKVFMSVISDEGGFITNSVKQEISNYLKDYNVGSITPEFVDPVSYGIDLQIQFSYNDRITNLIHNQLTTTIHSIVNNYNEQYINEFNSYFNEAKLIDLIMNVKGVETVYITKTVFSTIEILKFSDPVYEFTFSNEIKPGSVLIENIKINDPAALDVKIVDDDNGNLVLEYIKSGSLVTSTVGDVDYGSGRLTFTANIQHANDEKDITIRMTPYFDNFYTTKNTYVYVDDVDISLLTRSV